MTSLAQFTTWLGAAGVPAGACGDLARYLVLLERWAEVHSLVRFRDPRELVDRHVVDALAGSPTLAGETGTLVDVGSGAGFPAVPLLVLHRGWGGVLLEPRQKRWSFLRLVVREIGLACDVRRQRYEQAEGLVDVGCVTVRGVSGHERLLAWAAPRLRSGGELLAWVGGDVRDRLQRQPGWRVVSSPLPTGGGFLVRLFPGEGPPAPPLS